MLRVLLLPALLAALPSTTAPPARAVNLTVRLGEERAVSLSPDSADPRAVETTWYDEAGDRCGALADADDLGSHVMIALSLRCTDQSGRVVVAITPNILTTWDKGGSIQIAGANDALAAGVLVDGRHAPVAVERGPVCIAFDSEAPEGSVRAPVRLHRSFYARNGVQHYTWFEPDPDMRGLTCPAPLQELGGNGALGIHLIGRYRPGNRVQTTCTATTADGQTQQVPVDISFF